MLVDGHCHSCGFNFDAHWHNTGTCIDAEMTCPRCLIKGRCSTQTDEYNDYKDKDIYVDTESE